MAREKLKTKTWYVKTISGCSVRAQDRIYNIYYFAYFKNKILYLGKTLDLAEEKIAKWLVSLNSSLTE